MRLLGVTLPALACAVVAAYVWLHPPPRPLATWPVDGRVELPWLEVLFTVGLFAGLVGSGLVALDRLWSAGSASREPCPVPGDDGGAAAAGPGARPGGSRSVEAVPGLSPAERLLAGLVVGTVIVSLAVLALGLAGLFGPIALGCLCGLVLCGAGAGTRAFARLLGPATSAVRGLGSTTRPGLVLLAALLIPPAVLALCPPTGYDALFYHLRAPQRFLEAGRIGPGSSIPLAHYPFALQMLYSVGMSLVSDRVPGLIDLGFYLASLLAVAALARRGTADPGWLASCLLVAGVPHLQRFAGQGFVDIGVVWATTTALVFVDRYASTADPRRLLLAGISTGLACSIKHVGLMGALGVLAALAAWPVHAFDAARRRAIRLVLVAAVVASPWYIKSALWTGNPLFPAGNQTLHRLYRSLGVSEDRLAVLKDGWFSDTPELAHISFSSGLTLMGRGTAPVDLILLPLWLSVDSHEQRVHELPVHFAGEGSPLFLALLVLLPVAPVPARRFAPHLAAAATIFVLVSLTSQQQRFYFVVYALVAVPLGAVLASPDRYGRLGVALAVLAWTWGLAHTCILSWSRGDPAAAVGLMTRETYLRRNLECHGAFAFANRHLPAGSRILVAFEPRTYHLRVPHEGADPAPGLAALELFTASNGPDDLLRRMGERGLTHLYVPRHGFALLTQAREDDRYRAMLLELFRGRLDLIYSDGQGYLFAAPGRKRDGT